MHINVGNESTPDPIQPEPEFVGDAFDYLIPDFFVCHLVTLMVTLYNIPSR
jgi:hypothetical protein